MSAPLARAWLVALLALTACGGAAPPISAPTPAEILVATASPEPLGAATLAPTATAPATATPAAPTPALAVALPTPTKLPPTATAPGTSEADLVASYSRRTAFVPLDEPKVLAAAEASYLKPEDRVLGVSVGGKSRAYPTRMLAYHHIVNDTLAGRPILVTY